MSTLEVKAIQAPTGYDLQMPAGHILQVVQATTGTQVTSSSTSMADTGLTASITPSSTSNKILVTISQLGLDKRSSNTYMDLITLRGSTEIHSANAQLLFDNSTNFNTASCTWSYLDSPSSTSSVTYKTQFASISGSSHVACQWNSATSTIILQEIAG
tara:strand:+ start:51 stop:524 length:474 start_codon:yes stop_codon:yes gene_type:complete